MPVINDDVWGVIKAYACTPFYLHKTSMQSVFKQLISTWRIFELSKYIGSHGNVERFRGLGLPNLARTRRMWRRALKSNVLRSIVIAHCLDFGDEGTHMLADLLRDMDINIHHLTLLHCNVGDSGAVALAEVLKSKPNLRELQLSMNNIGDEGATALAELLRTNTTLKALHMTDNSITSVGLEALVGSLKKNRNIRPGFTVQYSNDYFNTHGVAAAYELVNYDYKVGARRCRIQKCYEEKKRKRARGCCEEEKRRKIRLASEGGPMMLGL